LTGMVKTKREAGRSGFVVLIGNLDQNVISGRLSITFITIRCIMGTCIIGRTGPGQVRLSFWSRLDANARPRFGRSIRFWITERSGTSSYVRSIAFSRIRLYHLLGIPPEGGTPNPNRYETLPHMPANLPGRDAQFLSP